jgi:hypothetical protein
MSTSEKKLTSVKVDKALWDNFRVECVRRKFSFQKLSERAIDLFLSDEEFRRRIINHNTLQSTE